MRIKRFLESVGGGWREVNLDELEKTMSGHRVDDITDGEVEKIKEKVAGGGVKVGVYPYLYYNVEQLKPSSFGSYDYSMVGRQGRRNNLRITWDNEGSKSIDIFKSEDDMFFVRMDTFYYKSDGRVSMSWTKLFVCDQVDGLLSMLKDMVA
jgi:hypothetical protein